MTNELDGFETAPFPYWGPKEYPIPGGWVILTPNGPEGATWWSFYPERGQDRSTDSGVMSEFAREDGHFRGYSGAFEMKAALLEAPEGEWTLKIAGEIVFERETESPWRRTAAALHSAARQYARESEEAAADAAVATDGGESA